MTLIFAEKLSEGIVKLLQILQIAPLLFNAET
jgi:hypothetical protein